MIRKLEFKDYEELQLIFKQLYDLHYANRPDSFNDAHPITSEYFNEILYSDCKHCYVYVLNNIIVGAILIKEYETDDYVTLKKRKIYEIYDIVVHEGYRGRGIGRELYNYIVSLANQNNISSVIVEVFAFNKDVIKFYEGIGMSARKIIYENILTPCEIERNSLNIITTNKTKCN